MSSYLIAGEELAATIRKATQHLRWRIRHKGLRVDAIAFRGISGAMVAPHVAAALGLPAILVAKTGETQHRGPVSVLWDERRADPRYRWNVMGWRLSRLSEADRPRYVIVDDFISSGATVRAITKMIRLWYPVLHPAGVLTYKKRVLWHGPKPLRKLERAWIMQEAEERAERMAQREAEERAEKARAKAQEEADARLAAASRMFMAQQQAAGSAAAAMFRPMLHDEIPF